MITVRFLDNDVSVVDDIYSFAVFADEKNRKIKVFHNGKFAGHFSDVAGMALADFVTEVKYLNEDPTAQESES